MRGRTPSFFYSSGIVFAEIFVLRSLSASNRPLGFLRLESRRAVNYQRFGLNSLG
jgi:hypothetical protein